MTEIKIEYTKENTNITIEHNEESVRVTFNNPFTIKELIAALRNLATQAEFNFK